MRLKDSLSYFGYRIAPAILNIALVAIITRIIPPDEYGHYSLTIAAVNVTNAVLFFWLGHAFYRHYPRPDVTTESLYTSTMIGFVISAASSIFLGAAFLFVVRPEINETVAVIAFFLLLAMAWSQINLQETNIRNRVKQYGAIVLLRSIFSFIFIVGGAYLTGRVEGLLIGALLCYVLTQITPQFHRSWRHHFKTAKFSWRLLFLMLQYGFPLASSYSLMVVVSTADRFMIERFLGAAAVGQYTVGYELSQFIVASIASSINMAHYPTIIGIFERGDATTIRTYLSSYMELLLAILAPSVAGIILIKVEIGTLVAGPAFRDATISIIPIIALAAMANNFRAFYIDYSFQLGRRTVFSLLIAASTAVINIGLNFVAIPKFGIIGAAWASVISYVIALVGSWIVGRYYVNMLPMPVVPTFKVMTATLVMILALWPLHGVDHVAFIPIKIVVGIAAYASAAFALNIIGIRSYVVGIIWKKNKLEHRDSKSDRAAD